MIAVLLLSSKRPLYAWRSGAVVEANALPMSFRKEHEKIVSRMKQDSIRFLRIFADAGREALLLLLGFIFGAGFPLEAAHPIIVDHRRADAVGPIQSKSAALTASTPITPIAHGVAL